jgi:hypothetical protein
MKYRLRYQQHDFELNDGRFMIGRGVDCQLALDDPLVSRNHALLTVSGDSVVVEDLGSRNGVRVNGQKVTDPSPVGHGDRIGIGTQEMVILRQREVRADTIIQDQPPTQRLEAFGLLGSLADKAIAMGRGDEAERILGQQLSAIADDAAQGRDVGIEVCERAADYAVKLAGVTGKGQWVDYVFELYTSLKKPCPAPVVDALYGTLRKARGTNRGVLRAYVDLLKEQLSSLNPTERFLLSRVEGLERLAALK